MHKKKELIKEINEKLKLFDKTELVAIYKAICRLQGISVKE